MYNPKCTYCIFTLWFRCVLAKENRDEAYPMDLMSLFEIFEEKWWQVQEDEVHKMEWEYREFSVLVEVDSGIFWFGFWSMYRQVTKYFRHENFQALCLNSGIVCFWFRRILFCLLKHVQTGSKTFQAWEFSGTLPEFRHCLFLIQAYFILSSEACTDRQ